MSQNVKRCDKGDLFKVAIVGDGLTGKTCLLGRYTKSHYTEHYKETIGADFVYKELFVEDRLVKLQFWDLSGQYIGSKEVTTNFFRESNGVMICFSLVDNRSLNNVEGWRKRSLNILGEDVPCVLVGTKADLGRMPEENWSFICESNKFHDWFQTSAKTGEGVKEAFEGLIKLMVEERDNKRSTATDPSVHILLNDRDSRDTNRPPKSGCSC